MVPKLAADSVVLLHFAFIVFVVFGGLLVQQRVSPGFVDALTRPV